MSELPINKATFVINSSLKDKSNELVEICAVFGDTLGQKINSYSEIALINRWTKEVVSSEKFSQKSQTIQYHDKIVTVPVSRYAQSIGLLDSETISRILSICDAMWHQHPFIKQIVLGLSLTNKLSLKTVKNDTASILHFVKNVDINQYIIKAHSNSSGIALGYYKRIHKKSELQKIKSNSIIAAPYSIIKNITDPHINGLIIIPDHEYHHLSSVKFAGPKLVIHAEDLRAIVDKTYVSLKANKGELCIIGKSEKSHQPDTIQKTKKTFYKDLSSGPENTSAKGYSFLNPMELIKAIVEKYKTGSYTDALVNYFVSDLRLDPTKPVIYQSLCISADSRGLLGKHGGRYIREHPDFFIEELAALRRLLSLYNFKDITLTLPFIRTVKELSDIKTLVTRQGLTRTHKFKLFLTLQVPSNILLLEDYLDQGVDGVIIDIQCLTDLTLGIDSHLFKRDYKQAEHTYEFINNSYKTLQGAGVCEASKLITHGVKLDHAIQKIVDTCIEITKRRRVPLYIYFSDDFEEELTTEARRQTTRRINHIQETTRHHHV